MRRSHRRAPEQTSAGRAALLLSSTQSREHIRARRLLLCVSAKQTAGRLRRSRTSQISEQTSGCACCTRRACRCRLSVATVKNKKNCQSFAAWRRSKQETSLRFLEICERHVCDTDIRRNSTPTNRRLETGLHDTYNREFAEPVLTDRPVEGAEGLAENIAVAFRSLQSHRFQECARNGMQGDPLPYVFPSTLQSENGCFVCSCCWALLGDAVEKQSRRSEMRG